MHLATPDILDLLFKYSYAILFPIAIAEGPIISIIAGFLVSVHFLELLPTYLILLTANVVGDIIFYYMGRLLPSKTYVKYFWFIKISDKTVEKVKRMILRDRVKTIIFGKLSHGVGALALIAAGAVGIPLREYLKIGFLVELPKVIVLIMIGYYFGNSLASLQRAIDYTTVGFLFFTVVFITIYFTAEKYSDKEVKKLQK